MGGREIIDATTTEVTNGGAVDIAAEYYEFLDKLLEHKGLSGDAQDAIEDAKLAIGKIAKSHSNYTAESNEPRAAIREVIAELSKSHGDELKKVIRESSELTPEAKAEARSVLNGKGFANEPETMDELADRQNAEYKKSPLHKKSPDKGWKRPGSETADEAVFEEIEDGFKSASRAMIRKPEDAQKMGDDFAKLLPKIEAEMEAMRTEAQDIALSQLGEEKVNREVTKYANRSLAQSADYQDLRKWKNFIDERTQGLDTLAHPENFTGIGDGKAHATAKRFLDEPTPKMRKSSDVGQRLGIATAILGEVNKSITGIENETFSQMFGEHASEQQKQFARDHVLSKNEQYNALTEQSLTLTPMLENFKGLKNGLMAKEAVAEAKAKAEADKAADAEWYKKFDGNVDRTFSIIDRGIAACEKALDLKSKTIEKDVKALTDSATKIIAATGDAAGNVIERTNESIAKNPEGVKAVGKAVEGVIRSTEVPIKATKDAIEATGDAAEKTGNAAKTAIESTEKPIRAAGDAAKTVIESTEKPIRATGDAAKTVIESTEKPIKATGEAAKTAIESTEKPIRAAGDATKDAIKEVKKPSADTSQIPDIVKDLVAQMQTSKSSQPAVFDPKSFKPTTQGPILT